MPIIRAVVFDIYKTLIDIRTDEESLEPYAFLSQWLSYHGVVTDPLTLRHRYLDLCSEEITRSGTPFPDFDIGRVFSRILLDARRSDLDLDAKSKELALLFRLSTTKSISVYPGVFELLTALKGKVRLGIVSNAQSLFTIPELTKFDLVHFFDAIVLSSDLGVRKPDPKTFRSLLDAIAVPPEEAVFVGDSLFDDVYGAGQVGMKTVWISRESKGAVQTAPVPAEPDYVVADGSYEAVSEILLDML